MYVKGRALGSIHVDLPVVEICLICQFHFDAFGRGFDELGQLLHVVVSINTRSVRRVLLTFAIRFWLPIIAAVFRWNAGCGGKRRRSEKGDDERNRLIKGAKRLFHRVNTVYWHIALEEKYY